MQTHAYYAIGGDAHPYLSRIPRAERAGAAVFAIRHRTDESCPRSGGRFWVAGAQFGGQLCGRVWT